MDDNSGPNPFQPPQTTDPRREPEPGQPRERRPPTFDTAMSIAKELWRDHRSTLLTAWGVLAGVWLVSSLTMGVGGVALGMDPVSQQETIENMSGGASNPLAIFEIFGPGYWAFMALAMVIGFVQVGVAVATFAPLRRTWVEKRNLSSGEVLGDMGSRILPGMLLYLVYSIITTIGIFMCCIPGLVAGFLLMPSFYLVGGRGDGIFDSLSTSFEWAKKHVGLLLIFIVIVLGASFGMALVLGVAGQVVMAAGKVGYVLSQLLSWFVGVFVGFFMWLLLAGTMITIEQAEGRVGEW